MLASILRRLAVFALVCSLIVPSIFIPVSLAQEPGVPTPDNARLITGQWENLPADQEHWYQFDYPGGNLPIRVWMDVVPTGNAGFQIWTGDQVTQLEIDEEVDPLVMGMADGADPGRVLWEGGFSQPGTYFIRVNPTTIEETQYLLNIGEAGPDSTEPEEPAEPFTEPEEPAEPIIEPEEPAELFTEPDEPAEPITEPEEPVEPFTEPEESAEPFTEPEEPAAPFTEPEEPAEPITEPEEPVEPFTEPEEPVQLFTEPEEPAELFTEPDETIDLFTEPEAPAELFTEPEEPVEPVEQLIELDESVLNVAPIAMTSPVLNVQIRTGPSPDYSVVRAVPPGTEMIVLGQDVTDAWLFVHLLDGTPGWVERALAGFGGQVPVVETPRLTQGPPAPAAPPSEVELITEPNAAVILPTLPTHVNIRSGPSTADPIIGSAPPDTLITVFGQDATSLWLAVRLADGVEGWVVRDLTNFIGTAPEMETSPITPVS